MSTDDSPGNQSITFSGIERLVVTALVHEVQGHVMAAGGGHVTPAEQIDGTTTGDESKESWPRERDVDLQMEATARRWSDVRVNS